MNTSTGGGSAGNRRSVIMGSSNSNQTKPSSSSSSSNGGWKSAIFIIFVEMAERFAYYGVAGNLIMYLTTEVGEPTATAAKNVNIWRGVSSLFPILGGFLADSYFGRYKTVVASTIIYLMGLVLLTISVSSAKLRHCHAFIFIALYTLSVGEGGHKPCVQTFAADQFDENLPEEKEAKSSFFNWWYLAIVLAATVATLVVIYIQVKVGWAIGFSIPTVAVAAALAVFLLGTPTYRKEAPVGSPLTRVAQVFSAAAKKWGLSEKNGASYYEENSVGDEDPPPTVRPLASTKQFRFLDKAALIDEIDKSSKTVDPWRLCSVSQVEEVKLILRLIPIWLTNLMFALVIAQLSTFFTKQGSTMIRTIGHLQVPPASFQVFPGLTILIAVPMYDRLLVPLARKITGQPSGITMLQRIGIGLFLSMLTMVTSALVEAKRVQTAKGHGLMNQPKSIVPMRAWWLLPQYVLLGLSEAFTVVGLQELFYDQVPEQLRSMGAAAFLFLLGVGSFLSSAVISVVQVISPRFGDEWLVDNLNKAHLDYFYWLLAGLSAVNLCVYVLVAKGFVYKKNNTCPPDSDTSTSKMLELRMYNYQVDEI